MITKYQQLKLKARLPRCKMQLAGSQQTHIQPCADVQACQCAGVPVCSRQLCRYATAAHLCLVWLICPERLSKTTWQFIFFSSEQKMALSIYLIRWNWTTYLHNFQMYLKIITFLPSQDLWYLIQFTQKYKKDFNSIKWKYGSEKRVRKFSERIPTMTANACTRN